MSLDLVSDGSLKPTYRPRPKNRINVPWFHTGKVRSVCAPTFHNWRWNRFAEQVSIEIGSAVVSILASGGPIAQAERMANVLSLHGLDPEETRRLHIGFSAGRFEFMARPYGIVPRTSVEEAAWPALRGQIFMEAAEIFLRLLRGDVINSTMIRPTVLTRDNFRSDDDWASVQALRLSLKGSLTARGDSHPQPLRV